jgi:hypothetical protein
LVPSDMNGVTQSAGVQGTPPRNCEYEMQGSKH